MLFDGIWYTPESQLCHTPKEKRPETPRESGRYIWWSWRPCNPLFNTLIIIHINVLYFTLRCNKGIKKVLWLKINHILNVMTNGEELNS